MAIFEIASDAIRTIKETTFAAAGIPERAHLQRLLRKQIEIISPDTLIVAEEFCEWEDSKRRIDLLGVDTDAKLVVIELKRTEDGGHMELQAIRYAAMVSTMTFDKVVDVYTDFLQRLGSDADARTSLLTFLDWDEPDEDHFAQDVRIVLVSAEFSKELTTAVMWLNERNLDIHCVRIKPYTDNGRVLIDVQQIIPLPEVADYQVQIREKKQKGRQGGDEGSGLRNKFWQGLLSRAAGKTPLHANKSPSDRGGVHAKSVLRGVSFAYDVHRDEGVVGLYIDTGTQEDNKRIYDGLETHQAEIEGAFGGKLSWLRLNHRKASRLAYLVPGGVRSDENQWPCIQDAMIDAMVRLEKAISPHLANLKTEA
jgi:Domain of unknown function (DUF4268)